MRSSKRSLCDSFALTSLSNNAILPEASSTALFAFAVSELEEATAALALDSSASSSFRSFSKETTLAVARSAVSFSYAVARSSWSFSSSKAFILLAESASLSLDASRACRSSFSTLTNFKRAVSVSPFVLSTSSANAFFSSSNAEVLLASLVSAAILASSDIFTCSSKLFFSAVKEARLASAFTSFARAISIS